MASLINTSIANAAELCTASLISNATVTGMVQALRDATQDSCYRCLILVQSDYLNILILGETGFGKSTFINAFINYLNFEALDESLDADKLHWVIPCSFSTQSMDRSNPNSVIEEQVVRVGASVHEHDGSKGISATQQTPAYPITIGMTTYRLIYTPGTGDTHGIQFDQQNVSDILTTLSSYDDLHGILILLKSNSARMTAQFACCVKFC
jgi:predicted GTPase